MAEVDNKDFFETGAPHEERVRAQLTGGTSAFTPKKMGKIRSVIVSVEGTNSMTYTWTGLTVTITGTNDDFVNISVVGEK